MLQGFLNYWFDLVLKKFPDILKVMPIIQIQIIKALPYMFQYNLHNLFFIMMKHFINPGITRITVE